MDANQRDLFDTKPPQWELDDGDEKHVARVVFAEGVDGEFDYIVPPNLVEDVQAGKRLRVPLGRGNRAVVGYCVGIEHKSAGRRLKEIRSVVDSRALISRHMLELTKWMADHYLARWGRVLEAVVPAGVRVGSGTREKVFLEVPSHVAAKLTRLDLPAKQGDALRMLAASDKALTVDELSDMTGCTAAPINALRKKGAGHGAATPSSHDAS